MPFNFSAASPSIKAAKPGVIADGDVYTTDGYGHTVTTSLNPYSVFAGVPTRSATGVWSVTTKDAVPHVMMISVEPLITLGTALEVVLQPCTTVSLTGQLVIHWTFVNSSGTATDLPANGQFQVGLLYSETSI